MFRFLRRRPTISREERKFRNRRETARVNGALLAMASPLFTFLAVVPAIDSYGTVLGTIIGVLMFAAFFVPGVLMIRCSYRMRRPTWLRLDNLRKRLHPDSNAKDNSADSDNADNQSCP